MQRGSQEHRGAEETAQDFLPRQTGREAPGETRRQAVVRQDSNTWDLLKIKEIFFELILPRGKELFNGGRNGSRD
jgi:hypothetical protein